MSAVIPPFNIFFQVMKDNMFEVEKLDDYDSDEEDDKDIVSRIINAPTKLAFGLVDLICNLLHYFLRTLLRAAAGAVLIAGVLVGVWLAWGNREEIADLLIRLKSRLATKWI